MRPCSFSFLTLALSLLLLALLLESCFLCRMAHAIDYLPHVPGERHVIDVFGHVADTLDQVPRRVEYASDAASPEEQVFSLVDDCIANGRQGASNHVLV
jgi:hypothetical protein